MRFPTIATAAAVLAVSTGASAQIFGGNLNNVIGFDLTPQNHYGAPTPPWHGGKPGWYYGNNPSKYPQYPCLSGILCRILKYFPYALQCPPPYSPPKPPHTTSKRHTSTKPTSTSNTPTSTTPTVTPTPTPTDGYTPVFSNITAAVQADDYMTFGLVDTVDDCKAMCNGVSGCKFINSYNDVNGKDGSTQLTCSLFSLCHTAADADNRGGQTQPDGSVDFIANSDGFCKN
ncbi:hypothetical protein D9619_011820 [Psilocybe cf. subviscida]|uniref:Apple domain-containing protein n=1 Tax=Psilocybe cf. subviscida TaxID=2480587 RepID=A0A8H5B0A3_9AGAR|nr:hypothetical protein D9619_011820 [Psilocybe cf. subviscida]